MKVESMRNNRISFSARRAELIDRVKKQYPAITSGLIVLISNFEQETIRFRQESSFYYYTGITEAGLILTIDLTGATTLYTPCFSTNRAQWVSCVIEPGSVSAQKYNLDEVVYMGNPVTGYSLPLLFSEQDCDYLTNVLKDHAANKKSAIFTLNPAHPRAYVEQKVALDRLSRFVPDLANSLVDISSIVAHMRRKKSKDEIELMYKAVELTMVAQEGAACTIEEGKKEWAIQAGIEYVFRESGAYPAFPSIVASGKNSTVLHYTENNKTMQSGDLVVVDIGAEWEHYCADITRTYPVSGTFTKRQREVYKVVLATQEYIADLAKPGMWLNNKEKPEQSLNHLAHKFLAKHGYEKYFPHGIGHFLGLDVHDVGDPAIPLEEGDVITIEPGIYIPEEKMGIRIEDDYWIIKDGSMCLSNDLPKSPDDIEEMAQADLELEIEDDGDEH